MLLVALKNLFQEKTRFLISVGGVAFSVVLIVILQALYQGWTNKLGEYINSLPAELWVGQQGSKDMFHTVSFLPLTDKEKIESINGIEQVEPFRGRRMVFEQDGKDVSVYLVSHDPDSIIGGPLRIKTGKHFPGKGEIIIDEMLANKNKVGIDDILEIAKRDFKVVGIATGGNLIIYSYAFVTQEDVNEIFKQPELTNYFMVKAAEGADFEQIQSEIERILPESKVVTRENFSKDNTAMIRESFLPIIFVLELIGFVVGIAIIGLTIYTSTIEKSREYGVLKAIGLNNRQLYSIVTEQAFIAGIIGYITGAIIAVILSISVGKYVTEFMTELRVFDFVWIFFATMLMSLTAAYIPIRRLANIDPAEVFKG